MNRQPVLRYFMGAFRKRSRPGRWHAKLVVSRFYPDSRSRRIAQSAFYCGQGYGLVVNYYSCPWLSSDGALTLPALFLAAPVL